ncbi:EamA-like transporter family protein [Chitinasiproducens palmae]|uniref:EamA-like transporter family protein n=1 Tax=Chitinasiproducens palmae TaxID=1770053 RepID=A0A1H2PKM6_9BURK|nr:EamA-like transporter family protein [Chitinasiproducens palmae]
MACTLFSIFAQNFAVKRSRPTRVALLIVSEPAFGALFACVWLGEDLSGATLVGGALMMLASLFATVPWQAAGVTARKVLAKPKSKAKAKAKAKALLSASDGAG